MRSVTDLAGDLRATVGIGGATGPAGEEALSAQGRLAALVVAAVLAAFAPIAQAFEPFWLNLLTRMLVFALLALSLDFVFGYAGLLSFGHAAMFGAGGYAAAILVREVTSNALVVLPLAALSGVVVAGFIGWFSVRAKGIYFAMLTLAFAQMFYVIVFTDLPARLLGAEAITGGDDGLFGIPLYEAVGIDFTSRLLYFYLALVLVMLSFALLVRVANSPFGRTLQGIRENEERMRFLGYNVRRYKLVAFSISGGFAGLAGGLYVPFQSVAQPGLLHWTISGELVVMLLLGGMGTLWGPMLGGAFVIYLEERLAEFATWEIILGSVFVIVVIFAPQGLAGTIVSIRNDPRNALHNANRALRNYIEKVRG
ncbi:branched-chain amino acid ABC transporter permease [Halalkalicoccus jeotgali]|uniref:Inner-membrane translocator n=1 Tax=Halalkalicoccus jeotgali (strain DSM 18796 / CECT 7217 / JCM 14584 / KCTC 4019 / B3) TaxID=795797 RepID=D8JB37_HALJB|nr:branched-chain amino acid ABC transporter permease [Halalkalicoccus jeotgali]ADJ16490.1 inner-membrane translocator [Halalkalicoccus jeotgali B3]ELY41414.1 inner-membrane translocator [Halalkalicoccus jeotgali B3]